MLELLGFSKTCGKLINSNGVQSNLFIKLEKKTPSHQTCKLSEFHTAWYVLYFIDKIFKSFLRVEMGMLISGIGDFKHM